MIHLLYGKDTYRVREALGAIRDGLRVDDDMLESNTTVLDGKTVTPGELLAHATALPFLAANRLVIVEGLLAAVGQTKRGRRSTKKPAADDPLAPWQDAADVLGDPAQMPETTTLVFIEGDLAKSNSAFPIVAPIAKAREFAPIDWKEIPEWIRKRAGEADVKLTDAAVRALKDLVGQDLWAMGNEIEKLAAYAGGEGLNERAVQELVPSLQEAKFWDMTDAVVAGNERKAVESLGRLLTEGEPPPLLSSMIARQYRQLVLVKEMRERRASQDEISRTAGVPAFKVNDVGTLSSRYTWDVLRTAYARMLDADLSVKRGLQDDESALQLLVHDLCALAPAMGGRSISGARR